MRLQNKIAIVTGASSGIGEGIAKMFAIEGAVVVCGSTNEEKGSRVAEEIKTAGGQAEFVKTDVSDFFQVENLVKAAFTKFGKLDVMVNNAGIASMGSVLDTTPEAWHKVLAVDLDGVFYGIKAAGLLMKEQSTQGSIINIASIAGLVGFQGAAAYCASKGGVVQLTREAALDLALLKIRVNSICPGIITSEMTKSYLENEEAKKSFLAQTPLNFVGEPSDIASMAVYLASDESRFVTGQMMTVDGGWVAK
jgi:meso-butanediol dehydrogenase / (S,S)-butanediol dehydrogenase / diacetyl reductase